MVRVRFAPSPTGYLHLGGARTALFNWLYARHHKGKFLLRIEDTDLERSTKENTDFIFKALNWLGITFDEEPTIQSQRAQRHAEIAHELLAKGHAYRCYCTAEELEEMRTSALARGCQPRYNNYWRDRDPKEAPAGVPSVIRFKTPQPGNIIINDQVQGQVTVDSEVLEDFVILRQDGSPTYMLAVVVDDHDMDISHIIRGDDHLTNAFKQKLVYEAMGWTVPIFAHIPLIHGSDGAKLSKRHGAVGVDAYENMGILPEAMCNYLLRLGWSHGNAEIISKQEAIEWFDVDHIGRSPARFDKEKLLFLNAHYLREADNTWLADKICQPDDTDVIRTRFIAGMNSLKQRAKTLIELSDNAAIYRKVPAELSQTAKTIIIDHTLVADFKAALEGQSDFTEKALHEAAKIFAAERNIKLVDLAQPLRVLLTGNTVSPSVFEIMAVLGKEETFGRLSC
jgi:glutamyl-tRNA synthetase